MTSSKVVFAAMKEAVEGPSGKALQKKFKVSPNFVCVYVCFFFFFLFHVHHQCMNIELMCLMYNNIVGNSSI